MEADFLVAGLGNPGRRYRLTRHNIGFQVVDSLGGRILKFRKFKSIYGKVQCGNRPVLLIKPQTFMNQSGVAVKSWLDYLHILPANLIVVHDDIDLPLGKIRIKFGGGDGGHRGVGSIIDYVGNGDFIRIRIGVGRPLRKGEEADYVLSEFSPEEREKVFEIIQTAKDAVEVILTDGLEAAQRRFN